jgi:hypothetical protein
MEDQSEMSLGFKMPVKQGRLEKGATGSHNKWST